MFFHKNFHLDWPYIELDLRSERSATEAMVTIEPVLCELGAEAEEIVEYRTYSITT